MTGDVVVLSSVRVTPASRPEMMLDPDVTVKAPGPVPTVSCASAAAFTETRPPVPAPNSEAATLRSLSTPVVADVSCNRHWFVPTCTELAITPVFAPLITFTTDWRLPSPVLTLVALSVPVRSPPENTALIVPVGSVQRDRLARRDAVEGLYRAAVDLHLAVDAGERSAVGRQAQRGRARCRR